MAGVSKLQNHTFDIVFDGALVSTTRASLIIELLKYFMYERQQIPVPVDQLDLLASKQTKPESNHGNISSQARKVTTLLDDLDQLFSKIRQAFEHCPEIEEIAVLFGGTVVSPKESYIIKFPSPCPDAHYLSLKSCQRNLFQQVISGDFLGLLTSSIAPTNMMVLVRAPRTFPVKWFLPKQNMKLPKQGAVLNFNLHCSYVVPVSHDLSMADGELELSGLEVLDCSQCGTESSGEHDAVSNSCNAETGADGSTAVDLDSQGSDRCPDVSSVSGCASNPEHKVSDATSTPFIPRFCQHQRLNYIYSSKKQLKPSKTLAQCDTEEDTCQKQNHVLSSSETENPDFIAVRTKRLTLSPVSSRNGNTTSIDADCIWYQSPIIIKGLKK